VCRSHAAMTGIGFSDAQLKVRFSDFIVVGTALRSQ
jgi:hypothetical protein